MTSWQRWFREKTEEVARAGAVIDIGGGHGLDRSLFTSYRVLDVNDHYKPDIIADIHRLPFPDASIEAVICMDVLEHVEDPFKAVSELHRVLVPGAPLLASVPFIWPYHAAPGLYGDFWRFSPDGLRILFKEFRSFEIVRKGGYLSMLAEFVPSSLGLYRVLRPAAAWLDDRVPFLMRRSVPAHYLFMRK